ncbi:MAG: hypothetical protein Q4B68_03410 [Bacteroidales bacterium]|nr:hypothetical protein [Bacteroidales bacterium]
MIAVLAEIGSSRFPLIRLEIGHLPILSKQRYAKYHEKMKPVCDGWYVNTTSDTEQKYMQLRSISDQLALNLKIEINTVFEESIKHPGFKRNRFYGTLMVTLPNGEVICNEKANLAYLETLKKIGIEDIMRCHINYGGKAFVSTSKVANNQVQIDEQHWVFAPRGIKNCEKMLRMIGTVLHINLKFKVLENVCLDKFQKGIINLYNLIISNSHLIPSSKEETKQLYFSFVEDMIDNWPTVSLATKTACKKHAYFVQSIL